MRFLVPVLFLVSAVAARAANVFEHKHENTIFHCSEVLMGNVKFIPSGREGETFDRFTAVAKEFLEPGGIFERLGIDVPPQILHFMPGGDVNSILKVNGFPVAHWRDGQLLSQPSRGLLYEIVISGNSEHYGFYRDDNSLEEQVSIFLHASAGHQHFSHNTRYPHFRVSDRIQEAYELSTYMDKIRSIVGGEEVSLWYQYLLSLTWAQDFTDAIYEPPEELKTKAPYRTAQGRYEKPTWKSTRNILQAFVANLPDTFPEWKKEMAWRFERLWRFAPGMTRTKIMNEGYAVLMQTILPKYSSLNQFEDVIHYCCMLRGVVRAGLDNPYWLGYEAWKNIYAKFKSRPEIARLNSVEAIDRAFIKYARTEILQVMDDASLLKLGLDADWVTKWNLALTKPWSKEEQMRRSWDGTMPPKTDPDPEHDWPYEILSRDPNAVIRSIVFQQMAMRYSDPRPYLTSFNESGNGNVALELSDDLGRQVALNRRSMMETLYVLAQMRESPVSLESTFEDETPPDHGQMYFFWRNNPQWEIPKPKFRQYRVRVTVYPDGHVNAEEVFRNKSSEPSSLPASRYNYDPKLHRPIYQPLPDLAKILKEFSDGYIYNLTLGQPEHEEIFKAAGLLNTLDETVSNIISGVSTSLQLNIPTAPRALNEFKNYWSQRYQQALKDAIQGRSRLIRRPSGVKISVLPRIPWLSYNRKSFERAEGNAPPPGVARAMLSANAVGAMPSPFRPGDLAPVDQASGNPGDIFWGRDPNKKKGQGESDEEDDGEESEQEDGEARPQKSEHGGDENFETVSLDDYADALAEEIKLPNLRPKEGMMNDYDDEIDGHRQRRNGIPMNKQILKKAYKRGQPTVADLSNDPNALNNPTEIIRRGIGRLRKQSDWYVRRFEPKPKPDINAVIFFIMDMSGSMDLHKQVAKQALYDLEAMLKRRYPKVKIVYITMNEFAHVYYDQKQFMAFKPSGGTRYAAGLEKATELYDEYPEAQWDRFPILLGDMDEALEDRERAAFEAMKGGAQFTSVIKVHTHDWDSYGLTRYFREGAEVDPYQGYVEIIPHANYSPMIFKQMFKNEDN